MGTDADDSQGKKRSKGQKIARLWWTLTFCICVGFILAQLLYARTHRTIGTWTDRGPSGSGISGRRSLIDSKIRLQAQHLDALQAWHGLPRRGRPNEVLVALCTFSLVRDGLLGLFMDTLLQSGVQNYLIVTIDKKVRDHLAAKALNVYYCKVPDVVKNITENNWAFSALKFRIIQLFIELGWNVLYSDIDVVVLKNPFDHLYRDHDLEASSDGYDDGSAYGHQEVTVDPTMGWSKNAQVRSLSLERKGRSQFCDSKTSVTGIVRLNLNSGFFYIRANARTVELMTRMAAVMEDSPGAWDQAELNHLLFTLSHGNHTNPGVSVRVMEIEKFMNSKVLFKIHRYKPASVVLGDRRPVIVHMNYHPDKYKRMCAAIQFFLQGNPVGMKELPVGSEPGTR